ncbi:Transferase protein [Dioscorea alata]|uniref:Transferase protein n=1 Tax=Dioscorea alata TaxID=55571 RepID=A0ACB7WKN5_DIOAL|nr:Transferase protein [Dioscorea alata]
MAAVHTLSRCVIKPSQPEDRQKKQHEVLHLTPWDLRLIPIEYIQYGILFSKPPDATNDGIMPFINQLKTSLTVALGYFYPLAGRLNIVRHHKATTPFVTISLTCNNEGAEFIHAVTTRKFTTAEMADSFVVPPLTQLFFPLNKVKNHEGDCQPLLAIQVTELEDGVFLGCSLNHAIGDGFSFWHFINCWSEISRTGILKVANPPVLDRHFFGSLTPPIHLPLKDFEDIIKVRDNFDIPSLEEGVFHFSAQTIGMLKAKANTEMNTNNISSLQALLAHVWRSITIARSLEQHQVTRFYLIIGCRPRLNQPLPVTYFGSAILVTDPTKLTAGELVEGSLGSTASMLNHIVASLTATKIQNFIEKWPENVSFSNLGRCTPCDLVSEGSHRFDVYGNDFGWGKPIAVRSGMASKFDGAVTIYPSPQIGGITLEICLSPSVLKKLIENHDFMDTVAHF